MKKSYRMEIVEEKEEGGFVVSYLDLPDCITCGETMESAVANALDAKSMVWSSIRRKDRIHIVENCRGLLRQSPNSLELKFNFLKLSRKTEQ